ncbi:MAG: ribonuclease H-like domain-containing protein [Spirochaetota bacterium]
MAGNLKARLERIRVQGAVAKTDQGPDKTSTANVPEPVSTGSFPPPWISLAPLVLFRRELLPFPGEGLLDLCQVPRDFIKVLFRGNEHVPESLNLGDLLFFDLETSGLSGGAGTVAFLAAFSDIHGDTLEVRQYLLLDYPGEGALIECIAQELNRNPKTALVSFNGKAFDTQILRSRFILQGRLFPELNHIDLLGISRLLWTGLVPSCSQQVLEDQLLKKKRKGDIPGALAPQIWFSFLREGLGSCPSEPAAQDLLGVCNHNILDIQGMVELLGLILKIGANPLLTLETYPFNMDRLALSWPEGEQRLGLLQEAGRRGYPRALYELARIARQDGNWEAYCELLEQILKGPLKASLVLGLRASIGLASYYEWKKGDLDKAEEYTRRAFSLLEALVAERNRMGAKGPPPSINIKLKARLERITAKQQNRQRLL